MTVAQSGERDEVFVSERERGLVRQLRILPAVQGGLTYELTRTFLFDTTFDLLDEHQSRYEWTPCREAVQDEPQSEGLVRYPDGLLVIQNGQAPEPPNTDPVNGYEFDGATQFKYVSFRDALQALED